MGVKGQCEGIRGCRKGVWARFGEGVYRFASGRATF